MKSAAQQWIDEGIERGVEQGLETVARNMLSEGDPIEKVARVTGLSPMQLKTI